jgi:phosphatidylinositol glycan class N
MTDQASHGDASPECTETPYVLWGAGVSPFPTSLCSPSLSGSAPKITAFFGRKRAAWRSGSAVGRSRVYSNSKWSLTSELREDIHQAQIAPLMSALLGVAAPTNGMFALPDRLLAHDVAGMRSGAFPAQV